MVKNLKSQAVSNISFFPMHFCFRTFLTLFLTVSSVINIVAPEADSDLAVSDRNIFVRDFLVKLKPSSFLSIARHRLVITRSEDEAGQALAVYVAVEGYICDVNTPHGMVVKVSVDGNATSECERCKCHLTIGPVSDGPHMLLALVHNHKDKVLASRTLLIALESDRNDGNVCELDSCGAEEILEDYTKLHRRILDPEDTSVQKRFLVVSSSHGLANTQIEEVRFSRLHRLTVSPRAAANLAAARRRLSLRAARITLSLSGNRSGIRASTHDIGESSSPNPPSCFPNPPIQYRRSGERTLGQ